MFYYNKVVKCSFWAMLCFKYKPTFIPEGFSGAAATETKKSMEFWFIYKAVFHVCFYIYRGAASIQAAQMSTHKCHVHSKICIFLGKKAQFKKSTAMETMIGVL